MKTKIQTPKCKFNLSNLCSDIGVNAMSAQLGLSKYTLNIYEQAHFQVLKRITPSGPPSYISDELSNVLYVWLEDVLLTLTLRVNYRKKNENKDTDI